MSIMPLLPEKSHGSSLFIPPLIIWRDLKLNVSHFILFQTDVTRSHHTLRWCILILDYLCDFYVRKRDDYSRSHQDVSDAGVQTSPHVSISDSIRENYHSLWHPFVEWVLFPLRARDVYVTESPGVSCLVSDAPLILSLHLKRDHKSTIGIWDMEIDPLTNDYCSSVMKPLLLLKIGSSSQIIIVRCSF